jgi:hypothetical protein
MPQEILSWVALIILAGAGTMLLVSRDWRYSPALLAALYLRHSYW